jgi:protein TonB
VIRLHVLANGMPDSVAVVDSSGREMFDESALRALKRWVFTPAMRDGVPEASTVTIPVVFKLDD